MMMCKTFILISLSKLPPLFLHLYDLTSFCWCRENLFRGHCWRSLHRYRHKRTSEIADMAGQHLTLMLVCRNIPTCEVPHRHPIDESQCSIDAQLFARLWFLEASSRALRLATRCSTTMTVSTLRTPWEHIGSAVASSGWRLLFQLCDATLPVVPLAAVESCRSSGRFPPGRLKPPAFQRLHDHFLF